MKRSLSLMGGGVVAALLLLESSAQAHIDMLGALKSRGGDQKQIPCDGARSAGTVYTFEPGAIITLGVTEGVDHDSYFRIAFDNDGEDGFKNPASIDPMNPGRITMPPAFLNNGTPRADNPRCMTDPADKCGKSDHCNVVSTTGATVLWDYIDPHLAADSAGTYTWTLKLPDVECENCTLQVIQVMEDPAGTFHGPFDGKGDMYHRCINIKLKKGAGTSGPGNAPGAAVKVGTTNPKFPVANINCLAGPVPDAGVAPSDAGAATDAGTAADAGSPTGTGGAAGGAAGTQGGAAGGTTAGSPSGAAGGTASGAAGGAASGAAGGTASGAAGGAASGTAAGGTAGTVAGGPGGASGAAGGTTGAGAGLPDAGTGATAGGAPTSTDDDDASCSVHFGGSRSTGAGLGLVLIAGLALARRRRPSR